MLLLKQKQRRRQNEDIDPHSYVWLCTDRGLASSIECRDNSEVKNPELKEIASDFQAEDKKSC